MRALKNFKKHCPKVFLKNQCGLGCGIERQGEQTRSLINVIANWSTPKLPACRQAGCLLAPVPLSGGSYKSKSNEAFQKVAKNISCEVGPSEALSI